MQLRRITQLYGLEVQTVSGAGRSKRFSLVKINLLHSIEYKL